MNSDVPPPVTFPDFLNFVGVWCFLTSVLAWAGLGISRWDPSAFHETELLAVLSLLGDVLFFVSFLGYLLIRGCLPPERGRLLRAIILFVLTTVSNLSFLQLCASIAAAC